MKRFTIIAAMLLLAVTAKAEIDLQRMADAIRVAEGIHSKHPYGVLSVKVRNETEARQVCLRSIANNEKRWLAAGRTNSFIEFMADRWCPVASDPVGHRNWIKNVTQYYQR